MRMMTLTKQRFAGAALVAASIFALGACGSSAGSDGASDASSTTAAGKADDTAYVTAVNAACATAKTEVDAGTEKAKNASVDDALAVNLEVQKEAITQLQTLSSAVEAAGGDSADAKDFAKDVAALPGFYTQEYEAAVAMDGAAEPVSGSSESMKAAEKLAEETIKAIDSAKAKAEKLGLTDCVAMFDAMDPQSA